MGGAQSYLQDWEINIKSTDNETQCAYFKKYVIPKGWTVFVNGILPYFDKSL